MLYKKIEKFLLTGLLFIVIPSIHAMEAQPAALNNGVLYSILEAIKRTIEDTAAYVNAGISQTQADNMIRLKMKELEAADLENQLNDLLADPTTPTEIRKQILEMKEKRLFAFQNSPENDYSFEEDFQSEEEVESSCSVQ